MFVEIETMFPVIPIPYGNIGRRAVISQGEDASVAKIIVLICFLNGPVLSQCYLDTAQTSVRIYEIIYLSGQMVSVSTFFSKYIFFQPVYFSLSSFKKHDDNLRRLFYMTFMLMYYLTTMKDDCHQLCGNSSGPPA